MYLYNDQTRYSLVGVDANRIFEAYIGNTGQKIYLIGYTDENCGFFDNAINKTPASTGQWVDVDASSDIPSGSTGVICWLRNPDAATTYSAGIRKNGSSDEFTYRYIRQNNTFVYQLCGVDANRIFECKIENTTLNVMLIGYTKSPVTFKDNGIDKSLSTTGSWVDIDVTSDTANDADGAILFMKNTATNIERVGDVRKNGSSDNHTADANISRGACVAGLCGMDSEQIFEGYISNTAVDFWLIGYCRPPAATYTKNYNADVLLKKPDIPKTYLSDVLLLKQGITKTYSMDALLQKQGITKTYLADVLLLKGFTKTYFTDVLLKKLDVTKTYLADVILGVGAVTYTKNYYADILLKKLDITKTYVSDVLLQKVGITKTYPVDVLLLKSIF